jgi:hypothetical protein
MNVLSERSGTERRHECAAPPGLVRSLGTGLIRGGAAPAWDEPASRDEKRNSSQKESMKAPNLRQTTFAVAGGLLLGLSSSQSGEVVIHNFDDPAEAELWSWESWSSPAETLHDTLDAGGGTTPGSMRVINNFPYEPGGYSQAVVTLNLGGDVDAETLYTAISFDVKLDPSSYPRVNGTSYGGIEIIFRNGADWAWNSLGFYELTASDTNWHHLSFPVKAPADKVHHLTLKLGQNNLTNTVIYNIDNIRWTESTVVPPPPSMAIEKTKPSLNLLAASPGQYDRQNIRTLDTSFGWIASSQPVSFSMHITEFPNAATYGGHQAHMFLVPGTPGNENSPDWNEPTCVLFEVKANVNGGGTATFHYKTNAPNSNGPGTLDGRSTMYFNASPTNGPVGQLGSVTGANILGTWTVTFSQDTNITLTAPDNTTTSFAMPPEDAAQFAGNITAYFGAMPGQLANIGQTVILGRVRITSGATPLLEESFGVSPLDPNVWTVSASSAAGVAVVTAADPYWVSWTTPASGFALQTNSTARIEGWGDAGLTDALVGARRRVLIPGSALPSPGLGFFRLIKP